MYLKMQEIRGENQINKTAKQKQTKTPKQNRTQTKTNKTKSHKTKTNRNNLKGKSR